MFHLKDFEAKKVSDISSNPPSVCYFIEEV